MWIVRFEQGRFFIVAAENEAQAIDKIVSEDASLANADILNIHEVSDVYEL
jgi:hypothetical protein